MNHGIDQCMACGQLRGWPSRGAQVCEGCGNNEFKPYSSKPDVLINTPTPYTPEERAVITTLQGQLAVFRGLANECLTLIGTLDGECEEAEAELAQLTVRLEKAIEGNLVCPLFI